MSDKDVPTTTGVSGCLVRLSWVVFGNLVLVLCLFGISQRPWHLINFVDAFCLGAVAVMIAMRYIDIRYHAGTKSTGEPATLADWKGYSWRVVAAVGAAWCVAHGYAWLSGAS